MKTKLIIALVTAATFLFAGCQKDEDDTGGTETPEADYQPTTVGSTWQYNSTTSGMYTETAVSGDTTIDGETYARLDNSDDSWRYVNKNGNVYKTYAHINELDESFVLTYLKDDDAGTTWQDSKNFTYNSFTIPVVFKYTIASRDGEKTVNDTTYKNVIAVAVEVTSNSLLFNGTVATGQRFYAKGVGNILSTFDFDALGTAVRDSTYLVSADIKK